ncbi:MAG: DUF86 domain-containing protein [Paenisporosarcina sp.]
MYFVDRKKINLTLTYMESLLRLLEDKHEWTNHEIDKLALERITINIIESLIDIGNSMIDGFIMRDPGSYDDIIDILTDENVISKEMAAPLKSVIQLRKMLVREFIRVDHEVLSDIILTHLNCLKKFPERVEYYLTNELGPVSAFLPEVKNENI